ncbi:MAG TPA: DUF4097 family beta strand repeat-containing protein [Vicinamibacterales bacterium]
MRHAAVAASLILAGFITMPSPASAQETGRFERTLTVQGPVDLSIFTGSGSIVVSPGADGTVHVVGTVRANDWWRTNPADARQAIQAVEANPPVVQNGSRIEIGPIADRELARRVSISYEVSVPRGTRLTSRSGSGSQRIGALAGPVTVSTGSGSVEVGAIGASVEISTGSGSVKVEGGKGRTSVSSGSGTVHAGAFDGDLQIRTGSGGIHVERVANGEVVLSSGSGSIEVRSLDGGLMANSASGSIRVAGTPTRDWKVSSSSGRIDLDIPAGTAFRVEANSSSGSIRTDHQMQVQSVGRRELVGSVGEGGSLVTARTSSGSIAIRKS